MAPNKCPLGSDSIDHNVEDTFVYGKKKYGIVDVVPGYFYVVTVFYHFNFIPVWPQRSVLKRPPQYLKDSIDIPLSWKSVVTTWMRLLAIPFFLGVIPLLVMFQRRYPWLMPGWLLVTLWFTPLLWLIYSYTPLYTRASSARACQLAGYVGISPEKWSERTNEYRGTTTRK